MRCHGPHHYPADLSLRVSIHFQLSGDVVHSAFTHTCILNTPGSGLLLLHIASAFQTVDIRPGMAYFDDFSSLAVALVLTLATWKVAYEAFFSPLSSIPNAHWSAPLSRLWILFIRFSRQENRTLHAAHRRLGPILRVGPRELSINDFDSVRTVYQGGFDKTVWYSVFDNYG